MLFAMYHFCRIIAFHITLPCHAAKISLSDYLFYMTLLLHSQYSQSERYQQHALRIRELRILRLFHESEIIISVHWKFFSPVTSSRLGAPVCSSTRDFENGFRGCAIQKLLT
ncbi:hypothetical protein C8Q75DRAFT_122206 [Abortiporus biennis]|nr:hypothetical protein C8Q75DRAFT_122206 [Abortiporus biennis]